MFYSQPWYIMYSKNTSLLTDNRSTLTNGRFKTVCFDAESNTDAWTVFIYSLKWIKHIKTRLDITHCGQRGFQDFKIKTAKLHRPKSLKGKSCPV